MHITGWLFSAAISAFALVAQAQTAATATAHTAATTGSTPAASVSPAAPVSSSADASKFSFPAKVQVGGRTVQLNGEGTRYRAMFKVYQAGLYLEKPTQNYTDITRSTAEAKRIHMVMQRTVQSDELAKMFTRGIQENLDRSRAQSLMSAMVQMSDTFSEHKRLEAGDQIVLDWVPGTGTVITVKGKRMAASIPEPAFFNALAGIWLGTIPADWKLREAMLGVKAVETAQNPGQQ